MGCGSHLVKRRCRQFGEVPAEVTTSHVAYHGSIKLVTSGTGIRVIRGRLGLRAQFVVMSAMAPCVMSATATVDMQAFGDECGSV